MFYFSPPHKILNGQELLNPPAVGQTLPDVTRQSVIYMKETLRNFYDGLRGLGQSGQKETESTIQISANSGLDQRTWVFLLLNFFEFNLGLVFWNLIPLPPSDLGNGLCRLIGFGDRTTRWLRIGGIMSIVGLLIHSLIESVHRIW